MSGSRRGLVGGGGGGASLPALSDNGTNVISTEPIQFPLGTALLPAIISTSDLLTGFYWRGVNNHQLVFSNNTNPDWAIGGAALQMTMGSGYQIVWSTAANALVGVGTTLRSRSANNFTFGIADVNGSPVAQTLSVQNAITGSNLAGAASTTFAGSLGTGTGTPGQFVVTGGDSSVASGTTAQTGIIRQVLNATKSLITGAATTLVSIPLATLQMCGGYISVYMEATDGTNQATRSEEIYYAGENSAGVFVVSTGVVGTGVTACTAAKTLTATYALTGANPALLQVTPTLTGITATRFTCVYEVHNQGNTNPTV